MSWNSVPDRAAAELLSLSTKELVDLSWSEAAKFVLDDTLEMAEWQILKNTEPTPIIALLKMRRICEELKALDATL